ncbi:MAG: hypothetical protein OXE73_10885 [Gammaproteobacteria bacterium]|nr:hypothetical protein [Gammaproteobacteria bacterium]
MRNRTARSHRFTPFAFIMTLGLSGCAQDDTAAPAGAVPRHQLGEPEAVSGDFASVNGIRVRPDGSLLVADGTGRELVLLDLDLGTRTVVGGRGEGPGEYQAPSRVWPLPGDSTLLLDVSNNRLTVLAPDLSFGATRPMFEMDPEGGILLLNPQVIDGSGRMYSTNGFSMNLAGAGSRDGSGSDSVPVVRATLDDLAADTVARLASRSTSRVEMRSNQGDRMVTMQRTPYSASDSWGVAPGGSVAVARAADYHLEWISSDGSVRSGAPVAWDAVPVGQAEKEAWVREQSSRSVQTATFMTGGGGGASPGSGIGGAAARSMSFGGGSDDVDDYEWPETLPPFTGSILIDPEGRAWLRRHQPVGAPFLYDIFTPDAEHAAMVEIAEGHTVMGFGDGVVYATFRDEVDLVYIERYRLPEM